MRIGAIAALAVAAFAGMASAQTGMTGSIRGTVSDASGARVPDAIVAVTSETGGREVTYSDDAGEWSFASLPAGRYIIQAGKPGFAPYQKDPTDLTASGDVTVDISLAVGRVSETVNVVAPRPKSGPASTPARTPRRIRVGGNIQATRLIHQVKPVYPEAARELGTEGSVILEGVISTDGSLLALQPATHTSPDLTQAAMDAVRQWRYTPTLLNGVPVEVQTTITVVFRLQ